MESVVDETPDPGEVQTSISKPDEVALDYEYALARAAILLDHAGDIASARQDIDAILQVSSGWLTLSNLLSSSDDGGDEEFDTSGRPIGFVGGGYDGADQG